MQKQISMNLDFLIEIDNQARIAKKLELRATEVWYRTKSDKAYNLMMKFSMRHDALSNTFLKLCDSYNPTY